jgi:hypothetical protein
MDRTEVGPIAFVASVVGAAGMILGGLVEVGFGLKAEGAAVATATTPLTAVAA